MITPVQRLALLGAVTTAALGAGAWALRPLPLPEPSPASAPLPVKPAKPEIVSFNPPGREESFQTDPFSGLMATLGAPSQPTPVALPSAPVPPVPQTADIRIPVLGRTVPVAVPSSIPVGVEREVTPVTVPVATSVGSAAPSAVPSVAPAVTPLDRIGNVDALDLTPAQGPVVVPPAPAPLSAQSRFEQQLAALQLGLETVALGQTDTAVFSVGGEFLVVSEGQPIAETGVIAEEISMRGAVLRKGDVRYVIDLRFPPPAGELTSPEVQP